MTEENYCKGNAFLLKKSLRIHNKELRKQVFSAKKNEIILSKIRSLDVYKKAKNILAFYPLEYEIDLKNLFIENPDNKIWFLPKCNDSAFEVCPFENEKVLIEGRFGTKEPAGKYTLNPNLLDLIILPGLAADRAGNRLGYGKGCYDKFLSSSGCSAVLVFPIFHDLIVDSVPVSDFDKKVQIIVTEEEIIFV